MNIEIDVSDSLSLNDVVDDHVEDDIEESTQFIKT